MVRNHQNGMMDPLNICGQTYRQFHWLTRADVFGILYLERSYCFNQMPIYRQRDRMSDIREKNEIIWNNCSDRLEIGTAMALFLKEITILKNSWAQEVSDLLVGIY